MRKRPTLRLLGLAALVVLAAAPAHAPAARQGPQVGILIAGATPEADGLQAGIRAGFRIAGIETDVLEKTAAGGEDTALATAKEFAFEGVDVVFALGPDAAVLARDALRETSVVFAGVGYPAAHGLPGRGNVCGVSSGVVPEAIVECVRRVAPGAQRLGILSGTGPEARHVRSEVARVAADGDLEAILLDDAGAGGAVTDCGAIWVGPGVPPRSVEALARALEGRRVALVGSRRAHLEAGCSVVLRVAPEDVGLQAAALARRVLDGEAPGELGVRPVRRTRLEIDLEAARRLQHAIPLPVLAAADHLAPAFGRRR